MKVLTNEEKDNVFVNLFQNKFNITCWQPDPEDPTKKIKYVVKLDKISNEQKLIIKSRFNKSFGFKNEGLVFFFCDKLKAIFKAELVSLNGVEMTVDKPDEVTLLEDGPALALKDAIGTEHINKNSTRTNFFPESNVMKLSSVNEDEKYAHMRASPRKQTNKEQKVTVRFLTKKFQDKEMDLFDLSRGGAGILARNSDYFSQGDQIEIIQIDGSDINPILKGEVMSVKTYDVEKGTFKAGIKFV